MKLSVPKKLRTSLIIVAAAALASASLFATAPRATPEEMTEKAWPVTTLHVEPSELGPAFNAYGRFEASQTSVLTSKVAAWIDTVHVREGDQVQAGQLLVSLDGSDFERRRRELAAAVDQARAEVASARSELKLAQDSDADYTSMHEAAQSKLARHTELLDKRLISQVLYDEVATQAASERIRYLDQQRRLQDLPNRLRRAQAEEQRAIIALEQAEADLDATSIRAPFTGPVLAVRAAAGELANSGFPLVEMAAAASLEVRAEIPQAYAGRLQAYLAEGVSVVADTEFGLPLELRRLARQVRPGQSGVDAFFKPTADQATFAIGQVAEISVLLPPERDLVALPVQSIYENDRVYVVQDKRLKAIDVHRVGEAGRGREHRVLVRAEALTGGAQVLATQLPQAVNGLLVEPITQS